VGLFSRVLLALGILLVVGTLTVSAQADTPRTVEFSGYTWELRRSDGLEGPGPNRYLDNRRTVWVDDAGDLHLKVWGRGGSWYCAEVILTESLGYGTYIFETVGEIDGMDPSVILGMFTYDHDPAYDHREIDIEYGRFGSANGPNAQFVLQPFEIPGNRLQFDSSLTGPEATHAFSWMPDDIAFAGFSGHRGTDIEKAAGSAAGLAAALGTADHSWVFRGNVPPPGAERVHLNLWLYQSESPARDHEVIFRSFRFVTANGR